MNWLCFITSLPTENATLRQRAWRALKSSGASVLRDGVYLLPDLLGNRILLDGIAQDVLSGGGTAMVLDTVEPSGADFKSLFNRSEEYAALLAELDQEWLPGVDLGSGNLNFTVVIGELLGNYEPDTKA